MGIVKFKKHIETYERFKFNKKLEKISSLFIDCNGIFHKGKAEIYKLARDMKNNYVYPDKDREKISKLDPKELERNHILFIINEFEKILANFRPTSTLILAPDGMAPVAKMQQQKERRYGSDPEEDKLFMGASISPGTDFMINLDIAIKKWLNTENKLFPKKVIYSSHLCPGEGEHKIFDFIRSRELETIYGNHVIYGADGDLFIIPLFSYLKNVYLYDENRKEYYDLNKFKKLITKRLSYNQSFDKFIDTQLTRDFGFLTFIIGNDFMHRLPNLYDTKTSMEILIDIYKTNGKNLTNLKNQIIWTNLLSFLKLLRDYKVNGMSLYEYHAYSNFTNEYNKGWITYPELRDSFDIHDLEGNDLGEVNYDPKDHILKLDMKKFSKAWYDKQFKPQTEELRKLYKDDKYYEKKDISDMCKNYFKTLQWCLYYYNSGDKKINKDHFYPYSYTPLLESLINYLEYQLTLNPIPRQITDNLFSSAKYDLTPIHQLMLILPPSNKVLIPSPFRELYTEKMSSISPVNFITIDQEGTDAKHVKIKLIPPVNPYLVKKVISNSGHKIPDKYGIDKPLIIKKF